MVEEYLDFDADCIEVDDLNVYETTKSAAMVIYIKYFLYRTLFHVCLLLFRLVAVQL